MYQAVLAVAPDHPPRVDCVAISKRSSFLLCLFFFSLITIPLIISYTHPSNPITLLHRRFYIKKGPAIHEDDQDCDLFAGNWVRDDRPLRYTNVTCSTIPESKDCIKYGKDTDYINWTWKPTSCNLPRLDATDFLTFMRSATLAFVGDSVSRNQMESLLCLLSQASTPTLISNDRVNGEEDRYPVYHFPSHNFTLRAIWTRYLIQERERVVNGSGSGVFDLDLDKPDPKWVDRIGKHNYIVMSSGHWFVRQLYLNKGGKRIGCVYCKDGNDLGTKFALTMAIRTALGFLREREGVTVLRTFTASHFESGGWDGGGQCNRSEPSGEGEVVGGGEDVEIRRAQVEEVERVKGGGERFRVVDVTGAMGRRADAHPGIHWDNLWMRGYSDCTHWCMPGPVDVWNDMLFAVLKKTVPRD